MLHVVLSGPPSCERGTEKQEKLCWKCRAAVILRVLVPNSSSAGGMCKETKRTNYTHASNPYSHRIEDKTTIQDSCRLQITDKLTISEHQNMGGVGIYVYRPPAQRQYSREHGNVGGLVGGSVEKKMHNSTYCTEVEKNKDNTAHVVKTKMHNSSCCIEGENVDIGAHLASAATPPEPLCVQRHPYYSE